MTYRGYTIKHATQTLPNLGPRQQTAIFDGDRLMAYVADAEFGKRVIDTKIKEGAWHDKDQSKTG